MVVGGGGERGREIWGEGAGEGSGGGRRGQGRGAGEGRGGGRKGSDGTWRLVTPGPCSALDPRPSTPDRSAAPGSALYFHHHHHHHHHHHRHDRQRRSSLRIVWRSGGRYCSWSVRPWPVEGREGTTREWGRGGQVGGQAGAHAELKSPACPRSRVGGRRVSTSEECGGLGLGLGPGMDQAPG